MPGSGIGPPTFLDDHATTWATAAPFVFTHISLSLFLAVSLHFWFSPCSDPVEMVSSCRCNLFASTYVSCTNTAKKKPWRKCRPHIAWQGWLKIVLSDVLLRLTYKKNKQILHGEHSKMSASKFSWKLTFSILAAFLQLLRCFQTTSGYNVTRIKTFC